MTNDCVIYNKAKKAYIARQGDFTKDLQLAQRYSGDVPLFKHEVKVPIKITIRKA